MIEQPLFAFYGDDFTGSTDALEALALHNIPTVLFLEMPDAARLAQFSRCQAIGLAGDSRSRSPDWMSRHLPSIFQTLKNTGAAICQYKVCSTFDSSPEIGNIGRALEIGKQVFAAGFVPIFSAAPHLKRYVLFANLFAAAGSCIYRIDRHPTMSCHPVTPMTDGDLRVHLARQTDSKILSFDIAKFNSAELDTEFHSIQAQSPDGILFDGWDEKSVRQTAGLVWEHRTQAPFVVGSSGYTHGLAEYWEETGLIARSAFLPKAKPAERLIVMAGSCSPVTERQIRWAMINGFSGHRIDVAAVTDPASADNEKRRVLKSASESLEVGRSVVVYSALGPNDCQAITARDRLGTQMGLVLRELLLHSHVKRAVIAGGDTSSYAGRQLGVYALTLQAPVSPGAPLCQAHTEDKRLEGLELVLKGGQVGADHFFGAVLEGRSE